MFLKSNYQGEVSFQGQHTEAGASKAQGDQVLSQASEGLGCIARGVLFFSGVKDARLRGSWNLVLSFHRTAEFT